jgi:hypothetical protein
MPLDLRSCQSAYQRLQSLLQHDTGQNLKKDLGKSQPCDMQGLRCARRHRRPIPVSPVEHRAEEPTAPFLLSSVGPEVRRTATLIGSLGTW